MYHQHVNHSNPDLNINISSNSTVRQVYSQMHFHSSLEFLYMKKGSYLCRTDKVSTIVKEGSVIFFNSRTPHSTESVTDEAVECIMLQFDVPLNISENSKFLNNFISQNNTPYYVFSEGNEKTKLLIDLITTIYEESKKTDMAHNYLIAAKKLEILALLHREEFMHDSNLENLNNKSIEKIMPIIEYIENNYNTIISLEEISAIFHMNKNYICKIFKIATGKTVMDYLNFVRIEHSRRLIKEGLPIFDISESVGFSSQSYFNKVFKKYILCSPTQYRKRFIDNTLA